MTSGGYQSYESPNSFTRSESRRASGTLPLSYDVRSNFFTCCSRLTQSSLFSGLLDLFHVADRLLQVHLVDTRHTTATCHPACLSIAMITPTCTGPLRTNLIPRVPITVVHRVLIAMNAPGNQNQMLGIVLFHGNPPTGRQLGRTGGFLRVLLEALILVIGCAPTLSSLKESLNLPLHGSKNILTSVMSHFGLLKSESIALIFFSARSHISTVRNSHPLIDPWISGDGKFERYLLEGLCEVGHLLTLPEMIGLAPVSNGRRMYALTLIGLLMIPGLHVNQSALVTPIDLTPRGHLTVIGDTIPAQADRLQVRPPRDPESIPVRDQGDVRGHDPGVAHRPERKVPLLRLTSAEALLPLVLTALASLKPVRYFDVDPHLSLGPSLGLCLLRLHMPLRTSLRHLLASQQF